MFFRSLESPVQQVMGLSGILKIDVRRRYRKILAVSLKIYINDNKEITWAVISDLLSRCFVCYLWFGNTGKNREA